MKTKLILFAIVSTIFATGCSKKETKESVDSTKKDTVVVDTVKADSIKVDTVKAK